MMVKTGLQFALALGLLPMCFGAMAAQGQAPADGGLTHEFAWLLGAVILGFSVIARRSPHPPGQPGPTPETKTRASKQEQGQPSGALS